MSMYKHEGFAVAVHLLAAVGLRLLLSAWLNKEVYQTQQCRVHSYKVTNMQSRHQSAGRAFTLMWIAGDK